MISARLPPAYRIHEEYLYTQSEERFSRFQSSVVGGKLSSGVRRTEMDTGLEEGLRRRKFAVAGRCSHVYKAIEIGQNFGRDLEEWILAQYTNI